MAAIDDPAGAANMVLAYRIDEIESQISGKQTQVQELKSEMVRSRDMVTPILGAKFIKE